MPDSPRISLSRALGLPILGIAVIVACLTIARRSIPGAAPPSPAPNLVLISIDTLRSDRLSAYGYHRDTSPFLESAAEEGVLFQTAVSVSSWTLPTHATIFSGVYPRTHGADVFDRRISERQPLLAEILQKNGYRTFGFIGGGFVHGRFGFKRGFEVYRVSDDGDSVTGLTEFDGTLAMAKRALDQVRNEPYFLFLHTYETHCPYNPPEPYASLFASDGVEPVDAKLCPTNMKFELNARQALYLSDRYDGAIRRVDDQLRSFFAFLESRDDWSRTVVVFTSDHGEEFFDHGKVGHRDRINPALLQIPLVIWAPGVTGRKVRTSVSQVDILPTILELLSVKAPAPLPGTSLVPLMRHGDVPGSEIRPFHYAEREPNPTRQTSKRLRASFGRDWLLVFKPDRAKAKLFPRKADRRVQSPGRPVVQAMIDDLNAFSSSLPLPESAP